MNLRPRQKFDGARAFMIVQLVLVLLLPFLMTQMNGCQGEKEVLPLNLGPEVSADALDEALSSPLAETDPTSIQLGEAFLISETQELGGGAGSAVLSDTSQTVIERQETPNEIFLTVIEHKQTYENGEVRRQSTEIPYRIEKAAAPATEIATLSAPPLSTDVGSVAKLRPEVEKVLRERSPKALLSSIRMRRLETEAAKAQSGVGALESRVTYHGLKVSVAKESPPELVQKQPGCLGLPDCKILVHRVSFDMVFWEGGKPDRVHWDIAMSPEAPYLASMLNKCVTGLATLSGNQGNILVKQCLPVLFFRYVQQP